MKKAKANPPEEIETKLDSEIREILYSELAISNYVADSLIIKLKALLPDETLLADQQRLAKLEELQFIQSHASGGGDWRRVIMERIAELKGSDDG